MVLLKNKVYYTKVWNGQYIRVNFMDAQDNEITNMLFPSEEWGTLKISLASQYDLQEIY